MSFTQALGAAGLSGRPSIKVVEPIIPGVGHPATHSDHVNGKQMQAGNTED